MKITKKQIKKFIKNGQVENLKRYCIFFNQSQLVDALHMLFTQEKEEYEISFESAPFSKGGRYAKHTSTLYSTQSWELVEYDGIFHIESNSTSKSSYVPNVEIPIFGTTEAIDRKAKIETKKAKEAKEKLAKANAKYEANLAKQAKAKRNAKAKELKNLAKKNGFKSVAEMKRKQQEIDKINNYNFEIAKKQQIKKFENQEGKTYKEHNIVDRVKLSRLKLNFERLPNIIN